MAEQGIKCIWEILFDKTIAIPEVEYAFGNLNGKSHIV